MKEREDLDPNFVGTCFDRQIRIEEWDQKKVSDQTALILGVGGLGSIVMMSLLRLGIKKIFILDKDIVETHNLNRQLMFAKQDVGKPKVQSAIKNSKMHNIGDTQIVGFHGDAVIYWAKVIQMAKESNVIFNCIDYGEYFDIAVAAVCLKFCIPLIMGGTYGTSMTVDYFPGVGAPCYLCSDDTANDKQLIGKITPENILSLSDISFLPKNKNPTSRSSVIVCTICGELMISHYVNYLCLAEIKPYPASRTMCYHNTFQLIKFDLEKQNKCLFCGDPNYVEPEKVIQEAEKKEEKDEKDDHNTDQQPEKQTTPKNETKIRSTQSIQQGHLQTEKTLASEPSIVNQSPIQSEVKQAN